MRNKGKDKDREFPKCGHIAHLHPALAWPSCQMRAYDVLLPLTPMARGVSVWAVEALTVNRRLPHK